MKVGARDGAVYVEAHEDIYGYAPALFAEAMCGSSAQPGSPASSRPGGCCNAALDDGGGMPVPRLADRATAARAGARVAERPRDDRAAHPDDRTSAR